jgi:hypothetical protein
MRLRPDMFDGQAPTGMTIAAMRDDRIHLVLDSDRSGDGAPVPINGLVFLRESRDRVFLEPVKGGRILPDLWTLAFRLPSIDDGRRSFSELAPLAATVPVWNLHRPLQVSNLNEVVERLVDTVTSRQPPRACDE